MFLLQAFMHFQNTSNFPVIGLAAKPFFYTYFKMVFKICFNNNNDNNNNNNNNIEVSFVNYFL